MHVLMFFLECDTFKMPFSYRVNNFYCSFSGSLRFANQAQHGRKRKKRRSLLP